MTTTVDVTLKLRQSDLKSLLESVSGRV